MAILTTTQFPVTLLDGSKTSVELAGRLGNCDLYRFIKMIGADNTPALVALCIGKDEKFLDMLSPQSFGELVKECYDRNFPPAATLIDVDPLVAAILVPFAFRSETARRLLSEMASQSLSANPGSESGMSTSPESKETATVPPLSVSAGAIGNVASPSRMTA